LGAEAEFCAEFRDQPGDLPFKMEFGDMLALLEEFLVKTTAMKSTYLEIGRRISPALDLEYRY
jgi:hypothetical protein